MSDSLRSHRPQNATLSCPSPSPRACSNSCSLNQWCHPTISSYVIPFSSCLLSFSASVSFPTDWFFSSGGQRIWSFSFSTSPSKEYSGLISFRIDWFDLLAVPVTLKKLLQHHSLKASIFSVVSFLYSPTLTYIHDYWKNHHFDYMDIFWGKVISAF